MKRALRVSGGILFSVAIVSAQALSGTVVGTVTDSAGAVIPGAKVNLTNEGTRFSRTVEMNQSGHY